jgi:hypothetical protein
MKSYRSKIVVGHTLQPGDSCWARLSNNGAARIGKVVVSDSTANTANINRSVRASIEVRDAINNIVDRAELR